MWVGVAGWVGGGGGGAGAFARVAPAELKDS